MRCPRCDEPVLIIEHEQIELDHCPACAGIWFDGEELSLLFAKAGIDIAAQLAAVMNEPALSESEVEHIGEKRLDCPRCDDRMQKVRFGHDAHVNIDRCDGGCGLWFDGGELALLMRHLNDVADGALEQAVVFVERVFPTEDDGDASEGPA